MGLEAESLDLRAIKEKAQATAPDNKPTLVGREETFRVVYHDPEGITHEAGLVSRIMSGDERAQVTRMCALLANGIPFAHLPIGDQARFYALSVCAVQLRDAPSWVDKWISQDAALLDGIFGQLEGHDLRYFRGDLSTGEGSPQLSRVEIDPIKPPSGGNQ